VWAAGVSFAPVGCGGAPEAVKSPEPAKVVWGSSGATPSSDAPTDPETTDAVDPPEATRDDETRAGPAEIDLDAPPPESEKPAQRAPAKEPEEAEEPEPEPPPVSDKPAPLEKEMRAAVKAKEKKSAKPKKTAAKKSAPAEPTESAASTYAGPNPCKAARFSVARVGDACSKGGRTAAKGVMKDAIGKALAAGTTLKCSDCHAEQRDYTLKPDGVAQLKKWLDG
jgi:outer membrane biosynthesis protein TonB